MPRYLCDAMLGSLARWLRLFGFDCRFLGPADDDRLAEIARREGRWLLTRDRELAAVGPRTVLIRAGRLDEQLREVFERHDLCPVPTLEQARCSACNGELEEADRETVKGRVPPYVARTAERFRACRDCGRVYWPGSHVERILRRMERICEGVDRDAMMSP
jgi:uncharacterized protein with PIN domain